MDSRGASRTARVPIGRIDQRRLRAYREHPTVSARIPGTDNAKFQEIANKAKTGCPVSKLVKAQITMDAKLKA